MAASEKKMIDTLIKVRLSDDDTIRSLEEKAIFDQDNYIARRETEGYRSEGGPDWGPLGIPDFSEDFLRKRVGVKDERTIDFYRHVYTVALSLKGLKLGKYGRFPERKLT